MDRAPLHGSISPRSSRSLFALDLFRFSGEYGCCGYGDSPLIHGRREFGRPALEHPGCRVHELPRHPNRLAGGIAGLHPRFRQIFLDRFLIVVAAGRALPLLRLPVVELPSPRRDHRELAWGEVATVEVQREHVGHGVGRVPPSWFQA